MANKKTTPTSDALMRLPAFLERLSLPAKDTSTHLKKCLKNNKIKGVMKNEKKYYNKKRT